MPTYEKKAHVAITPDLVVYLEWTEDIEEDGGRFTRRVHRVEAHVDLGDDTLNMIMETDGCIDFDINGHVCYGTKHLCLILETMGLVELLRVRAEPHG